MAATTTRMEWMDALRGIAVLLVVVWHATTVPVAFGDTDIPTWIRDINAAFSPYRMPLLLLLSGMLLPTSVTKPLPRYYRGKLRRIVWPLVVWTLILMLVTSGDPRNLLSPTYWLAGDYLWFLVLLCLAYLVGPLTRRIHPAVIATVLLIAYLVTTTQHAWLDRLMWYAPFFFVGAALQQLALVGDADDPQAPKLPASRMLVVPLLVAAGVWSVLSVVVLSPWERGEVPFIMSVIGAWAILLSARLWLRSRHLARVGRHSLIVYVVHYPVMILAVQLLDGSVTPTQVVVGLLGAAGLACYLAARFLPNSVLFVFPDLRGALARWRRRRASV